MSKINVKYIASMCNSGGCVPCDSYLRKSTIDEVNETEQRFDTWIDETFVDRDEHEKAWDTIISWVNSEVQYALEHGIKLGANLIIDCVTSGGGTKRNSRKIFEDLE